MGRTVGIAPRYLDKLNEQQRKFILTAVGRAFFDEFLTKYGKHLYIFGTTGSGKTNKGYAFVDWCKHLEKQVWLSSGKIGETLPLLCMGKKIEILVPDGCDIIFEEWKDGEYRRIENHPYIIPVGTPYEMLHCISAGKHRNQYESPDTITILEIRNAFHNRKKAVAWVADLFEELARACREEGSLPKWLFPMMWHIDESQWTIAGSRVANEPDRNRAAEVIAENALELRSAKVRLALYAQGYKNILPVARENMLFHVLCRGADVKSEENNKLSRWCTFASHRRPASPQYFRTDQGRFVFESNHNGWGDSYPIESPWSFRHYPIQKEDRNWCEKVRVRYVGKHDRKTEADEIQEECFPELGRFSQAAIPPEKEPYIPSRFEVIEIDETIS